MTSTLDNNFLSLDQYTNNFLYKQRLNLNSLIQPSESLPIKLIEIYLFIHL